ncbi:MAG TPA: type II secretion system protein GspL [Nitrospirota bacterium]|nr:type II secretion system protein GspL [Nitrospirota bacterium]
MKIVGIKIEKGLVAAAVVQKDFRRMELVDSFSQPFATDAELIDILVNKSGDWAGAKIIASIPGHRFTQRLVHFPFSDRKRVEKALPFELEDSVPFALDDVVIDYLILDGGKTAKDTDASKEAAVLGIMLPKEVLKRHLELLASAGIDPQVIVPSYNGLDALSKMMKVEGCTLLTCGSDLCLRSGETVKGLRSFSGSGSTSGIRHTVQALEIEQKERVEKVLALCPDDSLQTIFAEMGIAVEQAVPELGGEKAADPLSLGLALSEHVNFRKQEFAYHLADEGARRRKRTLIIAGVIAAALLVVNLGVKLYVVETAYGKLDKEIRDVYRQAVPDAKVVADPLRQLRSSLEEARKKFGVLGTGTSALDAMKAVTDGIPKEVRVGFQEFNLEGDRLKLQGEAASFESVDKIKAELQKAALFSDVTVLDTRMGTDNKVKFRLDIKLKQGTEIEAGGKDKVR